MHQKSANHVQHFLLIMHAVFANYVQIMGVIFSIMYHIFELENKKKLPDNFK